VKLTTTQPDFIREQSIVGLTQLCKKRLAESLFKIYAPTIIIDVVAMNLVNTFSHKFNDLLIPCIQCLVANNGDSKLSLCFFEDELGFFRKIAKGGISHHIESLCNTFSNMPKVAEFYRSTKNLANDQNKRA